VISSRCAWGGVRSGMHGSTLSAVKARIELALKLLAN
jgi:hypothetical protein